MEFNSQNELVINYQEQTVAVSEKSDQGQACVNAVEAVYLVSVILAIILGIGIVHNFFDNKRHLLKASIRIGSHDH